MQTCSFGSEAYSLPFPLVDSTICSKQADNILLGHPDIYLCDQHANIYRELHQDLVVLTTAGADTINPDSNSNPKD